MSLTWSKGICRFDIVQEIENAGRPTELIYKQMYYDILSESFPLKYTGDNHIFNYSPHYPSKYASPEESVFCAYQYKFEKVAFFIELFPALDLPDAEARNRADGRMRRLFKRFEDEGVCFEKVFGVCAFGRFVAIYTYDRETKELQPTQVEEAPIEWWCDILGEDGKKMFFEEVVEPMHRLVLSEEWEKLNEGRDA